MVLDSGGQYLGKGSSYVSMEYFDKCFIFLDGTTDVTRTLHFGTPTEEQKYAYTKVLMGAIDLSSLIFPSNLKINQADVMARAPLWHGGMDYMHGTGHGVGAFLSVHECRFIKFMITYFFINLIKYFPSTYKCILFIYKAGSNL